MRYLAIALLVVISLNSSAQQVIGVVMDKNTHELIPRAVVKFYNDLQITNINGNFFLRNAKPTDTVRVTFMGYAVNYSLVGRHPKDTLKVYLAPISNVLRDVLIRGQHDRKLDSLQNRREFASIFNYKAPTFYDAFNKVNPYEYHPDLHTGPPNGNAQIFDVNMLEVIGLLSRNKQPGKKLQTQLLRDEKLNYVDGRFTKKRIQSITKMQGDSLADFIYLYRPSIGAAKQMTDYDLDVYIKRSYAEYKSGKNPNKQPVVK